jgi:hypothetical protein
VLARDDGDLPKYPYGLTINLDDETLAKLGSPAAHRGHRMTLTARVEVCSTSQYQDRKGENEDLAVAADHGDGAVGAAESGARRRLDAVRRRSFHNSAARPRFPAWQGRHLRHRRGQEEARARAAESQLQRAKRDTRRPEAG